MSKQQKAIILKSRMGELVLGTREIPTIGAGELLVEIHATSLNPVDWKIQAQDIGGYIKSYPAVLGTDCAGIVKQVGDGVTDFVVGDRVYVYSTTTVLSRLENVEACSKDSLYHDKRRSSSTQSSLLRSWQR